MDRQFLALADRTRREILRMAWAQERSAGELAARFAISRPAVSQHLKLLREVGLVQVRHAGARRLYSTDRAELARLRGYLEGFWATRLAALRRAVEEEAADEPER